MKAFKHSGKKAFTLIELMVVISIIMILLGMGGLALNGSIRSQQISNSTSRLQADLNQAVLLAQKENTTLEVRFYKIPAPERGEQALKFRGWQVLKLAEIQNGVGIYKAVGEPSWLESGVILSSNTQFNTLADNLYLKTSTAADMKVKDLSSYQYASFEIRADGSTTLPKDRDGVMTLYLEKPNDPEAELPHDYRAIVINPFNGRVRSY